MTEADGNDCLYAPDGTLLLNRAMLKEEIDRIFPGENGKISFLSYMNTAGFAIGYLGDNGQRILCDIKNRKILSAPGDELVAAGELDFLDGMSYGFYYGTAWDGNAADKGEETGKTLWAVRHQNGVMELYDGNRKLLAKDGTPFTYALGRDCYAYRKGEQLCVEDLKTGEERLLPLRVGIQDAEDGSSAFLRACVAKDVYLLPGQDGRWYCIRNGKILTDSDFIYAFESGTAGEYSIVVCERNTEGEEGETLLFRRSDGKLLMQLSGKEGRIVDACGAVVLREKGSYLYFGDFSGACGLRLLSSACDADEN